MTDQLSRDHLRCLLRITAMIALPNEARLAKEFSTALRLGVSEALIREVILQSYLFAGYAAVINAFILLNQIAGSEPKFFREEKGSLEIWQERGMELCRQVYGSQFKKLRSNMEELHPDLAEWMIWEGYGKVLSRPFISPRVRELLIIAITAVLNVERQFYSHVRGAFHLDATAEEVKFAFDQVAPFLSGEAAQRFSQIVNDIADDFSP